MNVPAHQFIYLPQYGRVGQHLFVAADDVLVEADSRTRLCLACREFMNFGCGFIDERKQRVGRYALFSSRRAAMS